MQNIVDFPFIVSEGSWITCNKAETGRLACTLNYPTPDGYPGTSRIGNQTYNSIGCEANACNEVRTSSVYAAIIEPKKSVTCNKIADTTSPGTFNISCVSQKTATVASSRRRRY